MGESVISRLENKNQVDPKREVIPVGRSKYHIVHIVGTLGGYGVANLILGMVSAHESSCYRYSVICVFGVQGHLVKKFQSAGINAISCPFPWPDSLPIPSYRISRWIRHRLEFSFPWRLTRLLKQLKADIVHTHVTSRIDLQAEAILRKVKLPWVWTIHGRYRPQAKELVKWRKAARLLGVAQGYITVVANPLLCDLKELGIGSRCNLRVIPGGIDLTRFNHDARIAKDQNWRVRWNIPRDAVLFGCSGRLVPEKAYDVLVQAAAMLIQSGVNAHFVIAGDGRLRGDIQYEITRLGLAQNFHLIGFQTDIPFFLKQLDVFVLPSRSEGFPLALLEALGVGLPCIATKVGGIPDILSNNAGIMISPESPDDLELAMRRMLSPKLRTAYGELSVAAAQKFSITNWVNQFAEIYESLMR